MARLGRGIPIRSFFTRRASSQQSVVRTLAFGQPGEASDFLGVGHVQVASITTTVSLRFRQSGAWVSKPVSIRVSGAWATKAVSVRKAGSWSSI